MDERPAAFKKPDAAIKPKVEQDDHLKLAEQYHSVVLADMVMRGVTDAVGLILDLRSKPNKAVAIHVLGGDRAKAKKKVKALIRAAKGKRTVPRLVRAVPRLEAIKALKNHLKDAEESLKRGKYLRVVIVGKWDVSTVDFSDGADQK
jgi:hypothetical protein